MNIQEIKKKLNVETLPLVRTKDEQGQPTVWLRFWDNDNRVCLVVHEDLLPKIPTATNLGLKTTQEVSKLGNKAYTNHILIGYEDTAEVTY